jgi:Ala-tRNA(Pro) deacylase
MESAAEATFSLMTDLDQIKPIRRVEVAFDEPDPELALVIWLNGLLAEARTEGLALGYFTLEHIGNHWRGTGSGEPWRPELQRRDTLMAALLNCRQRLEHYLRERGVAYEFQHHPLAYTARAVAATEHVPPKEVAKSVVLMTDGRLAMVVLPASHELQISELARGLGVREARLAEEIEFGPAFPDCEVGAMPPFGSLYGVPVYVDASLSEDEDIVFQAGTHTDTVRIKYADYARLVNPIIVNIARPRHRSTVLT